MAFDDSTEDLESQDLRLDMTGKPLLAADQELRMRCVEAAALAVSGCQFAVQGFQVKKIADEMERYVKGG